jgi:Histidine kinase-, DNA gyrase B-, and HSP90-like ATPase
MTGRSRRSNPPERVWVRLVRVPIFDHLESTAVRPKTVLIMDIPSRAPRAQTPSTMSGTQSGSRPAPAILAPHPYIEMAVASRWERGQGYGDGPLVLQPGIWPHQCRPAVGDTGRSRERRSCRCRRNLALAISVLGAELAADGSGQRPAVHVAVEGETRELHPILRDEIYKIAAEALRNAFKHAQAGRVEVEVRYDTALFRLRVRDDGKGIDPKVLANQGLEGHYGLRGMPERAALIGGKLAVWSEVGAGTEVELRLPARIAYATSRRRFWLSRLLATKTPAHVEKDAS